MKKLIVGVDARPLSTRISGVGRYIAEILKHFPDKENFEFHLFSHLPIHDTHKDILNIHNIKFIRGKGFLSLKGGLFFNIYLPRYLRNNPVDLFWASQQILPPFFPGNIPIVMTYYDLVLYLYPATMRKIAQLQQKLFQEYSVKRSDHIVSISEETRRDMIGKFKYPISNTSVAYPGIDMNEIQKLLAIPPSEHIANLMKEEYFLSVSIIEPRKNYPFLLDVYSKYRTMNRRNPRKWVIAGKIGWESKEFIQKLYSEIDKYKDIIILDNINDSDLHHLYKNCKIFLFSSLYEGFGIPLLEAMAHRVNCIASDIGTFNEISKSRAHTLSLKDPEKWVMKILEIENKAPGYYLESGEFEWKLPAVHMQNIFQLIYERRNKK